MKVELHDFNDGLGPVYAYQHNGTGGWTHLTVEQAEPLVEQPTLIALPPEEVVPEVAPQMELLLEENVGVTEAISSPAVEPEVIIPPILKSAPTTKKRK